MTPTANTFGRFLGAAGNMLVPFVTTARLCLEGTAIESGTNPTVSYVRVYYRS